MPEPVGQPHRLLALDSKEREALRGVVAEVLPVVGETLGGEADRALRAVALRLSGTAPPDAEALMLSLSDRERSVLADAIDSWMADCNERRGDSGARERAVRRYRVGGVALRL